MDRNNRGFGEEKRYGMRRKKRMNRLLNAGIAIVAVLILFFSITLLFTGNEEASDEEQNQEQTEEQTTEPAETEQQEEETTAPEEEPDTSESEEATDPQEEAEPEPAQEEETNTTEETESSTSTEEQQSTDESAAEEEESAVEEEETEQPASDPAEQEEWEPVGTEQSGSFTPSFDRDGQNWAEMVNALSAATGLSEEEMTIYRLENGGSPTTAVGTVSNSENRSTPYRVEMEFIEGQGWQPTNVEVLSSNPY